MFLLILLFLALSHCNKAVFGNTSVIIVGSGPAGIAAATKLLENSFTNIKILEAENRIGGRINSVQFGDAFVDVGAEFCHGEKGNIVYELVKEFNILTPGLNYDESKVYYSNGSQIDPKLLEEISNLFTSFEENDDFNLTGKSIGDLITYRYNLKLLKKYENNPEKLKILKDGLRYFVEGWVISSDGSFSWFKSSAQTHYKDCEGDQNLSWNGKGYKTVLEILMKSYPDPNKKLQIDDKIYLNKKVIKINWNESQHVTVETLDNNSYTADHVIFTPSVGVLKEKHLTIFVPQLPSTKHEAIEAIGFDGVMKILIEFSTKWWQGDKVIEFYWSEEDLKTIDVEGPKINGTSWIVQLKSFDQAPNNPNVLICWVSGDLVPEIEKLPLDVLKNGLTYVMKKFLAKSYNLTEIIQIAKSEWCSNEHFKGTWSYTKTGTYREDLSYQANLAEPLNGFLGKPQLLFAGEATNPIHFSTVHGAIETGFREAERIIELSKK